MELINQLDVFNYETFGGDTVRDIEPGDCVSWDNLTTNQARDRADCDVAMFPYTSWGDYVGSTVERSNFDAIKEHFTTKDEDGADVVPAWLFEVSGGYGSSALCINLVALDECDDETTDELEEVLEGLNNYCVFDESHMSNLESELEFEDWCDWGRDDFVKELADVFEELHEELEERYGSDVYDIDNDTCDSFFQTLAEESNNYWEAETATGGHWRISDIVAHCTADKFATWFRVQFDAVFRVEQHLADITQPLFA